MPAPATIDNFLDVVRKSGLVKQERLDAALQTYRADASLPEEPCKLAGRLVRDGLLTRFQAEQLLLGKYRGFTIGKYKVLERIGAGGMGIVYLCEHQTMGRRVAVKVLPTRQANDPSALERFQREARAGGILDHPNIVRAHDIDQDGKLHFLVMEYVDGASMQHIVKEFGPMDIVRACHYVRQAALGLQHAHESGVVHRDIKPANFLLDRQGTVKLLDMGLARFFNDHADKLTSKYDENFVLGTADYIAPEQALSVSQADIRADIYSLGASFYFLLCGAPPFSDGTATQKLIWHQMRPVRPIQEHRPEVPAELTAILDMMMAKDPADRYQTPVELAEALAPWTETPIGPPPETEMPRLSLAATAGGSTSAIARARSGSAAPANAQVGASDTPLPRGDTASGRPTAVLSNGKPVLTLDAAAAKPKTGPPSPISKTGRTKELGITAQRPAPTGEPATDLLKRVPGKTPPSFGDRLRQLRSLRSPVAVLIVFGVVTAAIALGAGAGTVGWHLLARSKPQPVVAHPTPSRAVSQSKPVLVDPIVPAPVAPPPGLHQVIVTRSGQPNTHRTIREALNHARSGDHILVQDDTWDEVLNLKDAGNLVKDVIIEGNAPSGRPVLWQGVPHIDNHPPLLQLHNVEALHFRGFVLDGQNRVAELVHVSGHCPGLTLESIHLTRFRQCGVKIKECSGEARRPVALQALRTTTTQDIEAALVFEASADRVSRNVRVSDCRFEGPYKAIVCLAGPVAEVEFRHNRFFKADDAVLYRKANPPHQIDVTLVSNTFSDLQKGVRLEVMPPAEGFNRLIVRNNLFIRTGKLGFLDGITWQPKQCDAQWIWHEEYNSKGTSSPPEDRYFRKTFELPDGQIGQATLDIGCDDAFTVWVNGAQVGQSPQQHWTKHVYVFDVARHLRPGLNVLAVRGSNCLDLATGNQSDAALLVQLDVRTGDKQVAVTTDGTWKSSKTGPDGWQKLAFNDSSWASAKEKGVYNSKAGPWANVVWDSAVQPHFRRSTPLVPLATGNVRDYRSTEGFPPFEAHNGGFNVATDPKNDALFLRYPKTSPLVQIGSPGVPPADN